MADMSDLGNLQDLGELDLNCFLGNPPEECFPLGGLSPLNQFLPNITEPGEDVRQTGFTIDTSEFAGNYNFRVDIEGTTSKYYSFSDKHKRLYCKMDKAVPVKLLWEGPLMLHVRALLMFHEPDDINKPVHRCRSHNDQNLPNNQDCQHFEHVVRCDNENSLYKKNPQSNRHSVVTSFSSNPGAEGVRGNYRFMCSTTCAGGPGAIARRRTDLVLTLEENGQVVGRVVMGIKICSCPVRDRMRDEEEDGSKKKRKSQDVEAESRRVKRENCTVTSINDVNAAGIKQEVLTDGAAEYVDLQISVPNFPAGKVDELKSVLRRIVASFYASDEDIASVTRNVQIEQFQIAKM